MRMVALLPNPNYLAIRANGRLYSGIVDQPLVVPDFDANILEANGWQAYTGVTSDGLAAITSGEVSGVTISDSVLTDIDLYTLGTGAIFIGTSITNQGFNPAYFVGSGYMTAMNTALGWAFSTMLNAGVPGYTTSDMLSHWDTLVVPYYDQFEVAFIEPGPNDTNGPALTSAQTVSNVQEMASRLLALGKVVVILTPTTATSITTQAEWLHQSEVTVALKAYAIATENVFMADAARVFAQPSDGYPSSIYSIDGTHPSYPGAAVIGKEVAYRLPFIKTIPKGSSIRRDPKEYCVNPFFNGDYASGVRGYQNGTGVTGSGPESVAVGIAGGTFSSVTVSKGASLDDASTPIIINASNASANWTAVNVYVGSCQAVGGLSQLGRWDQNWTASQTVTLGDHRRLAAFPLGILSCLALVSGNTGVTGGTAPVPTGYGDIITDGGVVWMFQKLPSVGDTVFAEGDYFVDGLVGGIAPKLVLTMERSGGETFASALCPFFDISGASGNAPTTWPLSGSYRTPLVSLVSPGEGILLRHVYLTWSFSFTIGGGATFTIPRTSLRMI